jgi:hypothetical protein
MTQMYSTYLYLNYGHIGPTIYTVCNLFYFKDNLLDELGTGEACGYKGEVKNRPPEQTCHYS